MSRAIREPAVAGMFYPGQKDELRRTVEGLLNDVSPYDGPSPKAIIVPHAGYIYSGPVAARVYRRIRPEGIRRVVLLGPAHRVYLEGLGASGAPTWQTPLGQIPVEAPPGISVEDRAHLDEHSLEVQLPFLQVVLDQFTLIPIVVGQVAMEKIADLLASLWGGGETLIVISSDLSHYEDYETATLIDRATSKAILGMDTLGLDTESACGRRPIRGLLHLARQKGMRAELVDLRNSGDTAGPRDSVVGYGAYAFYE